MSDTGRTPRKLHGKGWLLVVTLVIAGLSLPAYGQGVFDMSSIVRDVNRRSMGQVFQQQSARARQQARERAERLANLDQENSDWFRRMGFDASVGSRVNIDFFARIQEPRNFVRDSQTTTYYEIGNQATYSVPMGPVNFEFHGAIVRMIEGWRVKTTTNDEGTFTSCQPGPYNFPRAASGWATEATVNGVLLNINPVTGSEPVYGQIWLKGYLTRQAIQTFVEKEPDSCKGFGARYVYRYRYHAPDGHSTMFYARPDEKPLSSDWGGVLNCMNRKPAITPEPNYYWSADGNASLDVSNHCKPIIRWADGSVEEFGFTPTEDTPMATIDALDFTIGQPYTPQFCTTGATDLHITDRNGNVTTFPATGEPYTQVMIDPQGRKTSLTWAQDQTSGFIRLVSVDLPAPGNLPPLHYSIQWRTITVDFAAIWPDLQCHSVLDGSVRRCSNTSPDDYSAPRPDIVDVVDSVTIPDGRTYRFDYGPWGNLTRVTEPNGAVREWVYGDATNLAYANAVAPLLNRIEDGACVGNIWSGEAVKMQARGVIEDRVYPEGLGGVMYPIRHTYELRQLKTAACSFDSIGAGMGSPGCSQVWKLSTLTDGTVMKVAMSAQRLFGWVSDDHFASSMTDSHGMMIAEETWSPGGTLLSATYFGDPNTGDLWNTGDVVPIRASPYAVFNSRPSTMVAIRDGIATTTNYIYGGSVDIDPNPNAVTRRSTGLATSECVFGGVVPPSQTRPDDRCTLINPGTPLARTDKSLRHYFDATSNTGINLLNLVEATRTFGPNAAGTGFSTTPVTEQTVAYDEFAVQPSGRPSSVLNLAVGTAAGAPRGNATTTHQRIDANKSTTLQSHYFDDGSIQSLIDPRGFTSRTESDFRLCSQASVLTSRSINALGHTVTTARDCNSGLPLRITDPNGQSTYTQYDVFGRVVETATPGDELTALPTTGAQPFLRDAGAPTGAGTRPGDARVTSWVEYLDSGVPRRQRVVTHVRDGSVGGSYSKVFTDGLGRTIQARAKSDPAKTGGAESVTTTTYAASDSVVDAYIPCFSSAADSVTAHCSNLLVHTDYDGLVRATKVTRPGNRVITQTYGSENGRALQTTVNARNFTTKTYADLLGRVVQIDQQSSLCGGFCSQKSTYDVAGRVLTQSDAAGNTVVYTYDDLGRRLTMSDPDMGHWTYEYDDAGNVTGRIDAKGQKITFVYDAIGRLTLKDLPPAGASADDVSYFYDGNGPTPPTDNNAPTLISVSPVFVNAGSAALTMTVRGGNFIAGTTVALNGQNRPTTLVSSQELSVAIPATDLQTATTWAVTVTNPPPGGGTSASATFTVNGRPSVTLTSPSNGQVFSPAPAAISLTATVVDDSDGATVAYYEGSTFLGSSTAAPSYSFTWSGVPSGSHTVRATVTDRLGVSSDSATITVTVAAPPTVAITAPTNGQAFAPPANVTVSANASSLAGIAKVAFYHDSILIAEDTTAPYSVPWNGVGIGSYALKAIATDVNGITADSAPVGITVTDAPTVNLSLSAPPYNAPATIVFQVVASTQSDQSLGLKDISLYANGTKLASVTQAYILRYTWTNVAAGSYQITATATNWSNLTTPSAPVDIIVTSTPPNAASFVSQVVPSSMVAGRTYDVSVTMQNSGSATWTAAGNYRLGSQNPQDNTRWGMARVNLPASVAPGAQTTFQFTVTAPSTPGTYPFQWQMVQDGVAWFGAMTTVANVPVVAVPAISGLAPPAMNAGGGGFTLTVNGSNFTTGSLVTFNGSNRTTTFVSATQLTASIPATDLQTAGAYPVTVVNPAPAGASAPATFNVTNPVPAVTSLLPSSAAKGGAAFTLTVNGSNFVSGAVVTFNGQNRTTTFVGATQLTASIPATDLQTGGSYPVTVINPAPGGGTSAAATFAVTNPTPAISSLLPASALKGGAAFTLTVNGSNFVSGAVVTFNGQNRTTTFVGATQLTASIPATDLQTGGSYPVTVINPAPGGGTSAASTFSVTNPAPAISSLSPANAVKGGAAFTLTVTGSNFVSGAVVTFNGQNRTTTFVGATQLTASIAATDLQTTGSYPVTVINPAPGGGASAAATFTVTNPTPAISGLSPASVVKGSAAFTLTVTGNNFVSGATVTFNGQNRTTTFVSATQLTASIAATDAQTAGSYPITVVNPAPGGGSSAMAAFTVNNPMPAIASITPANRTAASGPFTLTVNGSNFVSGAVVAFNGSNRTTTFVSASQLNAAMLSSDVQSPGTYAITVSNPAPSGGPSNAASLRVDSTVSITLPANGATFTTPINVTLNASATGSVSKVDFFRDSTLLGTATAAPYSMVWTNTLPGTYAVTAKATLVDGTVVQSGAVTVNIRSSMAVNGTGVYRASTDFSTLQGEANWYYLDGNGAAMTFDTADGLWHGSAPWCLLWGAAGHPGTTLDAVRQWRAPVSGIVRITGIVSDGNASCGNGVIVSIRKGAQVLWQQTVNNGNTAGVAFDVTASVAAGEGLDFVINSRNDFGCDTTNFDPTISYQPLSSTYRASADYSNAQGQAGWSYLDSNGTAMTYSAADGQWRGTEAANLLWSNGGQPSASFDAVRQWKAPVAGTVRIRGNASDASAACGNGVIVSIRKGTQSLWQQTIDNGNATGFSFDLTVPVAAGDQLNFAINNRGGDWACDATNFDPAVQYITTYKASSDYAPAQGQSGWYYVTASGTQMNYSAADGMWHGPEQYSLLWPAGGHPGAGSETVRQWRAPLGGSIVITGSASDGNSSCGNGVIVSIRRGTQVLWQQTIDNGNMAGFSYNIPLTVTTGDTISFAINNRDGDWVCDGTNFDPTIQYVMPALSRASTDYSSVQGQGGWYYLDGNGTPMTFSAADGQWHGSAPWSLLWGPAGHPGTTLDAVRQWKAPVSGTVRITGSASDGNVTCGNGVIVSIKKGTQVLWQQTIDNGNATGFTFDVTTTVAAGDQINFGINSRNDFGCDTTNFDPTVQYVPAW